MANILEARVLSRVSIGNLIVLAILAFTVRLLVSQMLMGGLDRSYEGDEGGYVSLAGHIAQGAGFIDNSGRTTSYRVPGLPLLVAIPVSIFGPNVVGIRIFMCFVESLLVPVFYLLVQSTTGSAKLALIGGMIAIFFPTWVIPSGAVMSDIPTAILVTLMVWMLIEGRRRQSLLWIGGAGICWGVATLSRAGSLIYAFAITPWLLVVMPDWKNRVISLAAAVIPFACVLAPWSIRNTYVQDQFVPLSTQAGIQLYISNNSAATGLIAVDQAYVDRTRAQRFSNFNEAERDKLFQAEAIKFIRENPARFVELCFIRFVQLWKVYSPRVPLSNSLAIILTFGIALPFFLVDAIRCGWRRGPQMLFLFIIVSHTVLHMIYGSIVRYRIPIEPLMMVMAISGFSWTLKRFRFDYLDDATSLSLNST